jgi:uncharacterized membrane protein required for colicin V production
MGLDIALGIMVLIGAVRGWFRGFVLQAIGLAGLVGCVYVADPLRDYARPHVVPYLGSVPTAFLDRMLWWTSAVTSYTLMVGLATLAVKLYRKRPYGEPEPNRTDQFAGFLLAGLKSAIVASFLVGAIDKYALQWIKQTNWATEMTKESFALTWNEQYHPSEKIWTADPVQHFVTHVKSMGIASPNPESKPGPAAEAPPVQTAETRPPRLDLPTLDINSPDFLQKFDEEIQRLKQP